MSDPTHARRPLSARALARAQRIARRFGVHVLTESLESPLPAAPPPESELWSARSELPDVDFDLDGQLALVEGSLAPFLAEFDATVRRPAGGREFPLWNGFYQAGDAEFLYALVRHFKPRRMLELGSGFSTFVSSAAAVRNAADGSPLDLIAVDPSPRADLAAGVPGLTRLETRDGRELPLERFEQLEANDILFVDTSHAVKLGGEVHWLVLEVLPRLNEGVIVHFHDVFLPYEYPQGLFDLWPYFTEQYLLHAFLVGNAGYRVLLGATALVREHPERLRRLVPSLSERADHLPWGPYVPSGFWIQRRAVSRAS